jgi:holo-[acyl-carrier protein] synthase
MIVGIGLDVCSVRRMARELARDGGGFRDEVFTPHEIAYCETRHRPAQHYAARFAAKEALFKALDTDAGDTARWREVEVRIGPDGRRRVVLHQRLARAAARRRVRDIHLSLTHDGAIAIANIVLESDEPVTAEVTRDGR